MIHPGMFFEPLAHHSAIVGFEIVGDYVDSSPWNGPHYVLQQLQVAFGVS
jgi:hypothetical protein